MGRRLWGVALGRKGRKTGRCMSGYGEPKKGTGDRVRTGIEGEGGGWGV